LAVALLDKAADLKSQADEAGPTLDVSPRAPDVIPASDSPTNWTSCLHTVELLHLRGRGGCFADSNRRAAPHSKLDPNRQTGL